MNWFAGNHFGADWWRSNWYAPGVPTPTVETPLGGALPQPEGNYRGNMNAMAVTLIIAALHQQGRLH